MCRSKKEACSYLEILQTVGVDRPADMLFVTDVFQEAVAAKAAGDVLLVVLKRTFTRFLILTQLLSWALGTLKKKVDPLRLFLLLLTLRNHSSLRIAKQYLCQINVSGLEVVISIRPGNGPLPANHGFRTIQSLLEI